MIASYIDFTAVSSSNGNILFILVLIILYLLVDKYSVQICTKFNLYLLQKWNNLLRDIKWL